MALRKIVMQYIPLRDRTIIAINKGNEESLLDNELRDTLDKMIPYGVSPDDIVEGIIYKITKADQVIIIETPSAPGSTFDEIINNNPELAWLNK